MRSVVRVALRESRGLVVAAGRPVLSGLVVRVVRVGLAASRVRRVPARSVREELRAGVVPPARVVGEAPMASVARKVRRGQRARRGRRSVP